MEIMLKNICCLYVINSILFFSLTICNLLIESPSYFVGSTKCGMFDGSVIKLRKVLFVIFYTEYCIQPLFLVTVCIISFPKVHKVNRL